MPKFEVFTCMVYIICMYHTCTCILLLGSRPHVTSLLVKLQELAECEEQLKVKNSELHQVNTRINQLETTAKRQVCLGI